MSAAEVAARTSRLARHRLDDFEWRVARPVWHRRWQPPTIEAVRRERPLGFLTSERAQGLRAHDPRAADDLVARAHEILGGRIQALGAIVERREGPGDVDPVTGYTWPDAHGKRVDFRSDAANPKWIWELERCQSLQVLTAAWLLTDDAAYAEAAAAAFERWVATHPPGRGIAWPSGFEAGIRTLSLALVFDGLSAHPTLAERLWGPGLATLWQHGRWIVRDPSTHSSANNHRIGELVGLLAIALLAPELPEADGWAAGALSGLRVESELQILPDGTGAEQSFAYTLFVLDLLLSATALLDAAGRDVPREVLDALERGARGLWAQVAEGEPEPDYGDRDDGRALRLDAEDVRDSAAVAASLCACLGSPHARAVATGLDATACWLFGSDGVRRFAETVPADRPESLLLESSGLAILRRGDTRVAFDAGRLGYLSLAAHGHADALSVTVSSGTTSLVVDPGTGTYFAGAAHVRDAFRGTAFHATVGVDDLDQSTRGGPFLWLRHARSRLSAIDLAGGTAAGEHDGYEALDDPVRHRRTIRVLATGHLVVHDRLDARSGHTAAVHWPLARDLTVHLEGAQAIVAKDDDVVLSLVVAATQPGVLELEEGSETPFAGWVSPRLEELVPAPRLTWRTAFADRLDIATLLLVRPARGFRPQLGLEADPDGVEISFLDGAERVSLRVSAA